MTAHEALLSKPCHYCGVASGECCVTRSGQPTRPHAGREWGKGAPRVKAAGLNRLSDEAIDDQSIIDRMFGGHPDNLLVYRPGEREVPEEGSWVMITRALPPIADQLNEKIRVCRVFYVYRSKNSDAEGFSPDGTYKVRCPSPWGEVCLWPYEYRRIEPGRIVELWQSGALIFHPTDLEPARFGDVTFYARSRGIGLAEAAVMALGTLEAPVGWFEPHPSAAAAIEEMAERINTSLAEHIRRNPRTRGSS